MSRETQARATWLRNNKAKWPEMIAETKVSLSTLYNMVRDPNKVYTPLVESAVRDYIAKQEGK